MDPMNEFLQVAPPILWIVFAVLGIMKTRYRVAFGLIIAGQGMQLLHVVLWKIATTQDFYFSSTLMQLFYWPGNPIFHFTATVLTSAGFIALVLGLIKDVQTVAT
jgi:hypothetical protein